MSDLQLRLRTGAPPGWPDASPEGLDIFHQPTWRECELPDPGPGPADRGTVLAVGRREDLGEARWIQALHPEARVVQADPGTGLRELSPASPVDAVYFLGPQLAPGGDGYLDTALELGPLSLLRLVKALGRTGLAGDPVPLRVLASGAYAVDAGGREVLQPSAAPLLALAKVAARECPWLAVTCVDLGAEDLQALGPGASGPLERLLRLRRREGIEVAFRRGKAWKRVLEPLGLAAPGRRELPLRRGGAYLILGAGEIGCEIAGQLISQFHAGVVLVDVHARLERMGGLGEKVLYCQGDATDRDSLQRAVRLARERFGAIRGALHAAAAGGRAPLAELDEAELRAGLGVKAQGSWNLYQATREEPLDLLLFFSSFEALFGGAGAAIEAAGGAFENAFAAALARAGASASRVQSICWGPWAETRRMADPETAERLREQGIYGLSNPEGLSAWTRALTQPAQQVVALRACTRVLRAMEWAPSPPRSPHPASSCPFPPSKADEYLRGPAEDEVRRLTRAPVDEAMFSPLERLAELLVVRFLQSRGFLKAPGEEHPIAAVESELAVAGRHQRLFGAILQTLVQSGWIDPGKDAIRAASRLEREGGLDGLLGEERRRLMEAHPGLESHVRLLEACVERLGEILRDELPATLVLFPDGSPALVEAVYRDSPGAEQSNLLVQMALRQMVEAWLGRGEETVRILEVGAGTGATTAILLPGLQAFAGALEYHYTDLSLIFLEQGEKKLGAQFPFLRFGLFNLDLDPQQQGWKPGTFHAIIAGNVLHATPDLRRTLGSLRDLLVPGGGMSIIELTRSSLFLTLTFGLLDGWWQHRDWAIRLPHSPLLDGRRWSTLLAGEGFRPLSVLGLAARDVAHPPLSVILAERDEHAQPAASSTKDER